MTVGAWVAVAIGIAAVVILALSPGSEVIVHGNGQQIDPPDDGSAVVASVRRSGGFSFLGWQVVGKDHFIEARFFTEPGCDVLLSGGDPWPSGHSECTAPAPFVGTVGGLGRAPDGRSIVGVEIQIERRCFEVTSIGDPWPSARSEC